MSDDENAELVHDWESDCYVLRDEITRLRAENSKSKSLIGELLDYAESLEGRLDGHDLEMLEDTDLKSRARAALEGVTEPPAGENNGK